MQSQKETEVGQVLQSYIVHSFEAPAHRCTCTLRRAAISSAIVMLLYAK